MVAIRFKLHSINILARAPLAASKHGGEVEREITLYRRQVYGVVSLYNNPLIHSTILGLLYLQRSSLLDLLGPSS